MHQLYMPMVEEGKNFFLIVWLYLAFSNSLRPSEPCCRQFHITLQSYTLSITLRTLYAICSLGGMQLDGISFLWSLFFH